MVKEDFMLTVEILCYILAHHTFPVIHADTPECEDGNMQLVGGSTEVEGAVQLCIGGVWGSVVSFTWEFSEARVVCRNLGRSENGTNPDAYYYQHSRHNMCSIGALPIPRFFFGDSAIFANFASCDGAEESLFDCELSHLSGETSETGYVVGVRCAGIITSLSV